MQGLRFGAWVKGFGLGFWVKGLGLRFKNNIFLLQISEDYELGRPCTQ